MLLSQCLHCMAIKRSSEKASAIALNNAIPNENRTAEKGTIQTKRNETISGRKWKRNGHLIAVSDQVEYTAGTSEDVHACAN